MPQCLARISIHLVFSTKNRERLLPGDIRDDLHAYMGGALRELDCPQFKSIVRIIVAGRVQNLDSNGSAVFVNVQY